MKDKWTITKGIRRFWCHLSHLAAESFLGSAKYDGQRASAKAIPVKLKASAFYATFM